MTIISIHYTAIHVYYRCIYICMISLLYHFVVYMCVCGVVQIIKKGSKVCYVGSPYQTSLSEAFQDKFLYCMTCLPSPLTPLSTAPSVTTTVSASLSTSSATPVSSPVTPASSPASASSSSSSLLYQWKEESSTIIDVGRKYYKVYTCISIYTPWPVYIPVYLYTPILVYTYDIPSAIGTAITLTISFVYLCYRLL